MQRRQRRAERRAEQRRTRSRFPTSAVILLAVVLLVGAVGIVLVQRQREPAGVAARSTATVEAPTPVRGPTPLPEPTAAPTVPTAAFTLQDRCVTTTLEVPGGPASIRGGGLDLLVQTPTLSEMSQASNLVVDVVCARTLPGAEVEALIERIRQIPGVSVLSYSYGGAP